MKKDLVLALGGGGVKGSAHTGVLRVLEKNNFRVRGLSGTSAGGLWGSLYAFGYSPDEIERRIAQAEILSLFRRAPGEAPAWMGLGGLRDMLYDALGDCRFEDLRMPFAVTAVDLNSARHIVIRSGRVIDAVLATIAVPGIFPSVLRDERVLVDGGVLDPVPVSAARRLGLDLPVVAVALSPTLQEWGGGPPPRLMNSLSFFNRYLERSRFTQGLNLLMGAIDVGGVMLTDMILAADPPDVLIRPDVRGIGLLDDIETRIVVRLGEHAAEAVLPELERTVTWPARWTGKVRRKLRSAFPMPYTTEEI